MGESWALGRGRAVGDYILGPKIGSGSFAVVWRARHRQHGVEVAVKEIDKKQLNSKIRDGLLKEIAILRQVSHPNIVRLHQAIQTEDKIFLVLEYCSGGDLAAYIQRRGRVSEAVARHFMRQLASGLQVLQENNLIHRDLKPQNLLLSSTDETPVLKIGDFGFARYLMPQGLADTLCGSPLYMAPEIMEDKQYGPKVDLWSVGAILFQLVTGKLPFDGNTHFQLFQNILASNELQFPEDVLMDLHPDCIDLCRSLLRRKPEERLAFEDFFNHRFLAPRISGTAVESHNTADVNLGDDDPLNSSDVHPMKTESMDRGLSFTDTSKVADSFDSIEQEYVLVPANFASMETLFSSLETSLRDNSTTRPPSYRQKMTGKGAAGLMQTRELAVSSICGVESVGSHLSALLSTSQTSTALEDVQETSSSYHFTRLQLLSQYVNALTELAQQKLHEGLHLESFSLELVTLAVWKEALRICNLWVASKTETDTLNTSANEYPSHQKGHMSLNIAEGVDFMKPSSVCSWAEEGFVVAYDRAEEISNSLRDIGDLEMPDAMEIIFQTALASGKSGAVDEVMGHRSGAIASYSRAIMLLTFIMVEAVSLPLNPTFSLPPSDRQRIQRYIMNLRSHLDKSHMAQLTDKPTNESSSK
ncbi:serine/threonine-protein kinase ATG1a-like isoform X1 [Phoenix dactylifera]|uniref:Serine/threonine-protein kinase ATG1a-like isoform X1 n=1 Tax=Phoenix dactylifera TaxID=42345 RepID=A0A8B7BQX6_PHODC|nr:serine/threonine-protein kinase ATG1a-like isoform X1 [Phoenix dactylifera]